MKHILILGLLFILLSCTSKSQSPDTIKIIKSDNPAQVRSLKELINVKEPAWPELLEMSKQAKNKVVFLPKEQKQAEIALLQAQVTTRSPMGAIIYETGGILIDSGWIRILGSGSPKLKRSLMEWNLGKSFKKIGEKPSFLLVADDVLGGFFAINAGGISNEGIGEIFYLTPETKNWERLGGGYSDFINLCFFGDLKTFYDDFLWKNRYSDLEKLNGDEGFSFFPFLFTQEAADIEKVSKKVVPIQEIWDFMNSNK